MNRKNKPKPAIKKLKIAVAMSGGVDSSVAAKLLKGEGHEVIGIFLHFWQDSGRGSSGLENKCCSAKALADARRVAGKIGVRLYVFDFAEIFKRQVVDNFLSEYAAGRTPNPCVRCNKLVKLGLLLKEVKKLGCDYLASGHYASIKKSKTGFQLSRAKDKAKDQSYFLYTLSQNELKHLLFPLSGYTKKQIRQIAKKFKLPVAAKPESQEICFISSKSHNDFLRRYLRLKPGAIKTLSGKVIGKHQGLPLYTIGQRKGINIGGHGPFYAAKMDYKKNVLYVVGPDDTKKLFRQKFQIKKINWLSEAKPNNLNCSVVIRYHQTPVKCRLRKLANNRLEVIMAKPERAVMPGQSAVFYQHNRVLGGGIIV